MGAAEAVRGLSQRLGEPWLRWSLGTYQVDLPLPKKDCQTTETTGTNQRCWDEDPDGEGGFRRLWYVGLESSWKKCIVHSLCLHSAIVKLEAWVIVRPALHPFLKVCFYVFFFKRTLESEIFWDLWVGRPSKKKPWWGPAWAHYKNSRRHSGPLVAEAACMNQI